jgi:glycosyltransferase involved in cell wall biosynthesis
MDTDIKPIISVVMAVYNAEKYLVKSINSILNQTYRNYELIIIDDHSMDKSISVINQFKDYRIQLIQNTNNCGPAKTRNIGIKKAIGEYIAIMDADDLSYPERLEDQLKFMENNTDHGGCSAKIKLIDENNEYLGLWNEDINNVIYKDIKKTLPKTNCIANPAFFFKSSVIKKYLYNEKQFLSEDYDLWLRLATDNVIIGKVDEFLLDYRSSTTSILKQLNDKYRYTKIIRVKIRFLIDQFLQGKINKFNFKCFYYMLIELFRIPIIILKIQIKKIIKK